MGPSFRWPPPALAISILALFVALGGGAYAASKIGSEQIRNGAVTTAKLKAKAVTTAKLRAGAVSTAKLGNDAVTGAKVNESTLGEVPSAASAQNAVNAQTAVSAANFSRYFTTGLRQASVGETIALATAGPFTFLGECIDQGGGQFQALAYVTTSEPGSFMYSYEERASTFSEGGFGPSAKAKLGYAPLGSGPKWVTLFEQEGPWTVASPDGSLLLRGDSSEGVHVFGADCAFALSWINEG